MFLRISLLFFFVTFLKLPLAALGVIYGVDSRREVFEETNKTIQEYADSTVAFVPSFMAKLSPTHLEILASDLKSSQYVCDEERFNNQPASAVYCSGFLATPTHVVTAGHCAEVEGECNSDFIVFNYRNKSDGSNPNLISLEDVYQCKNTSKVVMDHSGASYAIIELDRPVTKYRPLKFRENGLLTKNEELVVIGNTLGLPTKISDGAFLRSLFPETFKANLDTYIGSTGSPVINKTSGLVEGVVVRGAKDFVWLPGRSCNISNVCPDDGCVGETVTRIDVVKKFFESI